jgi:hypothetical protein
MIRHNYIRSLVNWHDYILVEIYLRISPILLAIVVKCLKYTADDIGQGKGLQMLYTMPH